MTNIVEDMDSPVRPLQSSLGTQSYGSFQRQGTESRLTKQGTGFQKIKYVSYTCPSQNENVKFYFIVDHVLSCTVLCKINLKFHLWFSLELKL